MKDYTNRNVLQVRDSGTGDNIVSENMISDVQEATAVINISVLKRMLFHIPKVPFRIMKENLIEAIEHCGTKEEIETVVTDTLDFGNIMKAIGEFEEIGGSEETACDADLSVGKIDLRH